MNSFTKENLNPTVTSFAFYNFIIYVLGFLPLFNEQAVFFTYNTFFNMDSLGVFFYLCFILFAYFSFSLFGTYSLKFLRIESFFSKGAVEIFLIAIYIIIFISLCSKIEVFLSFGSNFRHLQVAAEYSLLGKINLILEPLVDVINLSFTLLLINIRTHYKKFPKNLYKKIYYIVFIWSLSQLLLSTTSNARIELIPSLIVLFNPDFNFKFISLRKSTFNIKKTLFLIILGLSSVMSVLYSFWNKNKLDFPLGALLLEAFGRVTTHSQALYFYLFNEAKFKFDALNLLERRLCVLFGGQCGPQEYLTPGAVNLLNTFSDLSKELYAGSSPGIYGSLFISSNSFQSFIGLLWILILLISAFYIIYSSTSNLLVPSNFSKIKLLAISWGTYGIYRIYFYDPLDGLSITSPVFVLPFFSYFLITLLNGLKKYESK